MNSLLPASRRLWITTSEIAAVVFVLTFHACFFAVPLVVMSKTMIRVRMMAVMMTIILSANNLLLSSPTNDGHQPTIVFWRLVKEVVVFDFEGIHLAFAPCKVLSEAVLDFSWRPPWRFSQLTVHLL